MKDFLQLIGIILIYIAVDYGRTGDSVIEFFSTNWWITFGLVTVAYFIIKASENLED